MINKNDVERIIREKQRRLDDLSRPETWDRYTKDMECGELKEFKQSCIDDEIIIEALKKQIPQKGVLAAMDGFKPEYAATLLCPTCSKQIVNVWNKKDYKPKYCHYCGQALDWSD